MDKQQDRFLVAVQREVEALAAHRGVLTDLRSVWFDREYGDKCKAEIVDNPSTATVEGKEYTSETLKSTMAMLLEVLAVIERGQVYISKMRTDL